ncbi:apolipoprotein N-acyltransferase [Babesia caballi]|uniref:Apolipoprotein N-acyltransferase n=1 Tax=Babesia caballi TaxID=5871 RepID=A0AAV4LU12_BABCB|nr:apolipoprotein N-acyltransferase [Babesia caballi]
MASAEAKGRVPLSESDWAAEGRRALEHVWRLLGGAEPASFDRYSFAGGVCFGTGLSVILTRTLRRLCLVATGGLVTTLVGCVCALYILPQLLSHYGLISLNKDAISAALARGALSAREKLAEALQGSGGALERLSERLLGEKLPRERVLSALLAHQLRPDPRDSVLVLLDVDVVEVRADVGHVLVVHVVDVGLLRLRGPAEQAVQQHVGAGVRRAGSGARLRLPHGVHAEVDQLLLPPHPAQDPAPRAHQYLAQRVHRLDRVRDGDVHVFEAVHHHPPVRRRVQRQQPAHGLPVPLVRGVGAGDGEHPQQQQRQPRCCLWVGRNEVEVEDFEADDEDVHGEDLVDDRVEQSDDGDHGLCAVPPVGAAHSAGAEQREAEEREHQLPQHLVSGVPLDLLGEAVGHPRQHCELPAGHHQLGGRRLPRQVTFSQPRAHQSATNRVPHCACRRSGALHQRHRLVIPHHHVPGDPGVPVGEVRHRVEPDDGV